MTTNSTSARSFLRKHSYAPLVHDLLDLEEWLALSSFRKTHPICVLFARQYANYFAPTNPTDAGSLSLRQLSYLSDDLLTWERQLKLGKRPSFSTILIDVQDLSTLRIGRSASVLFTTLFDQVERIVMPSIRALLNGSRIAMESVLVDALITYNEDLCAGDGGKLDSLLTTQQREQAKRNISLVQAYSEYLPSSYLEALQNLPSHSVVVKRGENTDAAKLTLYGLQVAERFLYGAKLLPQNHCLILLEKLIEQGATRSISLQLRDFSSEGFLLPNIPFSLVMILLERSSVPDYKDLCEKLFIAIHPNTKNKSL